MNDMLDKTLLKILKICVNVIATVWTIVFIFFLYVLSFTENWYRDPVFFYPIILSAVVYISTYKFYKILKNNNGSISNLQFKVWLLTFCLEVFLAHLYVSVVIKCIFGMILFFILAIATIYCLNYIKKN